MCSEKCSSRQDLTLVPVSVSMCHPAGPEYRGMHVAVRDCVGVALCWCVSLSMR